VTKDRPQPSPANLAGPHPLPEKIQKPGEGDRTDDPGPGRDERDPIDIEQDQAEERD
jgi:hypothetical protein